jgi:predicted metallopeptidase
MTEVITTIVDENGFDWIRLDKIKCRLKYGYRYIAISRITWCPEAEFSCT